MAAERTLTAVLADRIDHAAKSLEKLADALVSVREAMARIEAWQSAHSERFQQHVEMEDRQFVEIRANAAAVAADLDERTRGAAEVHEAFARELATLQAYKAEPGRAELPVQMAMVLRTLERIDPSGHAAGLQDTPEGPLPSGRDWKGLAKILGWLAATGLGAWLLEKIPFIAALVHRGTLGPPKPPGIP
jgi:hypothetical protein